VFSCEKIWSSTKLTACLEHPISAPTPQRHECERSDLIFLKALMHNLDDILPSKQHWGDAWYRQDKGEER